MLHFSIPKCAMWYKIFTENGKCNENSLCNQVYEIAGKVWKVQWLKHYKYRKQDEHAGLNRVIYDMDYVIKCSKNIVNLETKINMLVWIEWYTL